MNPTRTIIAVVTSALGVFLLSFDVGGYPADRSDGARGAPNNPIAPRKTSVLASKQPLDPEASRARAGAILSEALSVPTAYRRLGTLTDTIGHRLAGSQQEP